MNALVRHRAPARAFQAYLPPAATAILTLTSGSCRWPVGEVEDDDFRFCRAPCCGGVYCEAHRRLARRRGQ